MITIKFRPRFRDPMFVGIKTMTCRTSKMGEPGDLFEAFGTVFLLTHVMRMRLGYVIADCFTQEGCASMQDLTDVWVSIHPKKGVDLEQVVWAHIFRMAGNPGPRKGREDADETRLNSFLRV